jgi:hypothetical protein
LDLERLSCTENSALLIPFPALWQKKELKGTGTGAKEKLLK